MASYSDVLSDFCFFFFFLCLRDQVNINHGQTRSIFSVRQREAASAGNNNLLVTTLVGLTRVLLFLLFLLLLFRSETTAS